MSEQNSCLMICDHGLIDMYTCNRTKSGSQKQLPQVMPSTYEEIVLYLEGKRSFNQLFEEQGMK